MKGVAGDLKTAFPDMEMNAFGFSCEDPIEPNRVWYFVRPRGTFKGSFRTGFGTTIQPTGKKLIGPPEVDIILHACDLLIFLVRFPLITPSPSTCY